MRGFLGTHGAQVPFKNSYLAGYSGTFWTDAWYEQKVCNERALYYTRNEEDTVRKLLIAIILSLLCASSSSSQVAAADRYRDLVQRLKSGDKTVDFTEFRMAFDDSSEFRAPDSKLANRVKAALMAGQYQEALSGARKLLDEDYADAQTHIYAYHAHKELGHKDEAAFHQFIGEGLLTSVEKSGDGKSKATAYVVISMTEVLLPLLREQVKEGGFAVEYLDEGTRHWCKFGGVDAHTNQRIVLYFNVDIPVSRIKDQLTKKKMVGAG